MKTLILAFSLFGILFLQPSARAMQIDLTDLRKDALMQIQKIFDQDFASDGEFWFQDGAGSLDEPPVFDYASIVFVATGSMNQGPWKNLHLGYRYGLNGIAKPVLVQFEQQAGKVTQLVFYPALEGSALFKKQVSPETVNEFANRLQKAHPGTKLQVLKNVGALSYAAASFRDAYEIFNELEKLSDEVEVVVLAREYYRLPFRFEQPIRLGTGKKNFLIAPDSFRSLTKQLRESGLPFASESSFPLPFGRGYIPAR